MIELLVTTSVVREKLFGLLFVSAPLIVDIMEFFVCVNIKFFTDTPRYSLFPGNFQRLAFTGNSKSGRQQSLKFTLPTRNYFTQH